jgi:hypothetical protein
VYTGLKKSDTSITVIYHGMSLTVLYLVDWFPLVARCTWYNFYNLAEVKRFFLSCHRTEAKLIQMLPLIHTHRTGLEQVLQ